MCDQRPSAWRYQKGRNLGGCEPCRGTQSGVEEVQESKTKNRVSQSRWFVDLQVAETSWPKNGLLWRCVTSFSFRLALCCHLFRWPWSRCCAIGCILYSYKNIKINVFGRRYEGKSLNKNPCVRPPHFHLFFIWLSPRTDRNQQWMAKDETEGGSFFPLELRSVLPILFTLGARCATKDAAKKAVQVRAKRYIHIYSNRHTLLYVSSDSYSYLHFTVSTN